jgi:methylmalonyl-CoA/ethylmalonyl-CoA epimerase
MNLAFHHLGIACRDITRESATWTALGYAPEGAPFDDPVQGITGCFFTGPGPRLELLMPLGASTVLDPWLTGGSRPYHQAFEVVDIDAHIAELEELGGRVMVDPVPAVAFDGRRISFVMLRNLALIELIEAPSINGR